MINRCTQAFATMLGVLAAVLPCGAYADVSLPHVLAEHMVIQRDRPVHLWGDADAGEQVQVRFRENHAETRADALGRWSATLPAGQAGSPFDLTIIGENKIAFQEILVGDVWLASGQSNMEFPMGIVPPWKSGVRDMTKELKVANFPTLRLFHVEMQHADFPQTDTQAKTWRAITSESVASFSAVAYFFGREILQNENIPIGIMEVDVGASPIEAWMSMDSLTAAGSFMPVFQEWSRVSDNQEVGRLTANKKRREYQDSLARGDRPDALEDPRSVIFYAQTGPLR